MPSHINEPRLTSGLVMISSADDRVTITGAAHVDKTPWCLHFVVKDNRVLLVEDSMTEDDFHSPELSDRHPSSSGTN